MTVGLVLEGGGMRGVYTGGVLQYLMEQDLYLPYVIGVSAGACNGSSYVSRQLNRNKVVTIDYITHPAYLSARNLVKKGSLFDMDFIFNELPMNLAPFDFESFRNSDQKFVMGVTDCITGEPLYFEKNDLTDEELLTVMRASSSLPYMAPIITFREKHLLDGGVSDPIPIRKSEQDGNQKNIVILTRNKGYQKKKSRAGWLMKKTYKQDQGIVEGMLKRHIKYNDTIAYIEEQEALGNTFIIRPEVPLEVDRIEKNPDKLQVLYDQGYEDAKKYIEDIKKFIED